MRKKILLMIISVTLFIPVSVYAYTGAVNISCPSTTIAPGASITCNVYGTTDVSLSNVGFDVSTDGDISFDGFEKNDSIWPIISATGNKYSATAEDMNDSGSLVAGVKVTASSSATEGATGTLTITNVVVGVRENSGDTSESIDADSQSVTFTISNSSSGSDSSTESGSGSSNSSESSSNPKTMDTNVAIISGLLVFGLVAVYFGRKKLDKISK